MIDHYQFGQIKIDGKEYTADVIIYPDRVDSSWWRKEGHNLCLEDIERIMETPPEVLIIGIGADGCMVVPDKLVKDISAKGVKVIVEKTGEACKTYNKIKDSARVVAALHLTC